MRSTFGGEGDVADLLQLSAQMEMDDIDCIRLVAARLQKTELDDKTITWGASGESVWGDNVLSGAAAERRDIVLIDELTVIHPQAWLQHERAINLNPDNKLATALAFVQFHNDMQHAPKMGGFSLLNHNVPPLLLENAAFHKFNKKSAIGPWIDVQGVLKWDLVTGEGLKVARNVRSGNTSKEAAAIKAAEAGAPIKMGGGVSKTQWAFSGGGQNYGKHFDTTCNPSHSSHGKGKETRPAAKQQGEHHILQGKDFRRAYFNALTRVQRFKL